MKNVSILSNFFLGVLFNNTKNVYLFLNYFSSYSITQIMFENNAKIHIDQTAISPLSSSPIPST